MSHGSVPVEPEPLFEEPYPVTGMVIVLPLWSRTVIVAVPAPLFVS